MIKGFLSTFPLPDNFKQRNNWNTQIIDNTSFSPLDSDAGEMAEGNRPIEFHIHSEIIKVKTWQDVLIKFLKYLKDKPDFDFEFILDNQAELFRSDKTIIKWSFLKELIDAKPELLNRYKTFDGKVWDKVKELNDDLIFIHIHISATVCMARIANVMQKFNIANDAIVIKLKD
jgi:hypothetical protein